MSKGDKRELVSSAQSRTRQLHPGEGGGGVEIGKAAVLSISTSGADLKGRKVNNKRESVESDTHREFVHRLSIESPVTSPSQKLFLHSLRERHLATDEEDYDSFPVRGGGRGRQHEHIELSLPASKIVPVPDEAAHSHNHLLPPLLSWDSTFARKADKKRHFTSRRATVNDRKEAIIAGEVSSSSKDNNSQDSSIKLASVAGDQQDEQGQTHSRRKQQSENNNDTTSSSRSSLRTRRRRQYSGRSSAGARQQQHPDSLSRAGPRSSSSKGVAVLEGNTADGEEREADRVGENSRLHSVTAAQARERQPTESDEDEDEDQDEYDDNDEYSDEGSSTSDDDNSAIEDLMSQMKMSECNRHAIHLHACRLHCLSCTRSPAVSSRAALNPMAGPPTTRLAGGTDVVWMGQDSRTPHGVVVLLYSVALTDQASSVLTPHAHLLPHPISSHSLSPSPLLPVSLALAPGSPLFSALTKQIRKHPIQTVTLVLRLLSLQTSITTIHHSFHLSSEQTQAV